MKGKRSILWKFIFVVIIMSLFTVGCSTNRKVPAKSKQSAENIPQNATHQNTIERIPDSLDDIQDYAEDIIGDILEQDWADVNEKLSLIEKEWGIYKPIAEEKKVSKKEIDTFDKDLISLRSTIEDKKPYEASLAANKVYLNAVNFMDLYEAKVLTDLERMEYYGRQVVITAKYDDWERAKKESELTIDTWNKIKKQYEDINLNHARSLSDTLNQLLESTRIQDIKKVDTLYERMKDEIDLIESDFENNTNK
ncbi:hypothetical protein KQI42_16815 [Tissierella sp. MSJ-40]|uniref:Lipoprotein n=1 Tax=Tissierella simiarum TaxID=2841534 RepID=A0ABS6E9T1_9FIRM|nr:hypothetical protein [Tissierella simiarum]MBU5439679.1 hypothetical protein [Tissierella simiarum]